MRDLSQPPQGAQRFFQMVDHAKKQHDVKHPDSIWSQFEHIDFEVFNVRAKRNFGQIESPLMRDLLDSFPYRGKKKSLVRPNSDLVFLWSPGIEKDKLAR